MRYSCRIDKDEKNREYASKNSKTDRISIGN